MASTVAVKGPLLRQIIAEVRALRRQLTESERLCAQRNVALGTLGQRVAELEKLIDDYLHFKDEWKNTQTAALSINLYLPIRQNYDKAEAALRSALTKQSEG